MNNNEIIPQYTTVKQDYSSEERIILGEIRENLVDLAISTGENYSPNEDKLLNDIKNFLINKKQLYSIFAEKFNCSVKDYILAKRIEKAKDLLKNSDLSVSQIAESCGFADYNNFIQRFKLLVGETPLRYKKSKE